MSGFRREPAFRSFFAKVKPFFAQIREMKHDQVTFRGVDAASQTT